MARAQSGPATAASAPQVPPSSHVFLVVLENTSYATMTNSADATRYMPHLVALGNAYGHTTNYVTNSGGSLLAYLWLSSGYCHSDPTSTADCPHPPFPPGVTGLHSFGCTGGGCINPTTQDYWPITDDNIYREMINHTPTPISWKLYAESIPYAGYTGPRLDPPDPSSAYDPHHNAPLWYADVGRDPAQVDQQLKMVPFTQFVTDLQVNELPQYSIIIPNDDHDAHDGTPAAADAWLQTNVFGPLLSQPFFQPGGDGLLIVTFDNDDQDGSGLVYTAIIGPQVKPGYVSNTPFHHEDTLLSILEALGISARPGYTAIATGLGEFFPVPTAVLSTSSLSFGSQMVGVAASRSVTLSNTGSAPLAISSIGVTAGDFTQANDCGSSLAAGAFCTVTVKFTPSTTGTRTGTLTFVDSVAPPQTVSLSGTGVNPRLSVTKPGTGTGTVTSTNGSINCGATCSATFPPGTIVTLTATPATGSTFGGWGGSCSGTSACSVTMSTNRSVSATFNSITPPLQPARPVGSVLDPGNALASSLAGLFLMNEGSGSTDLNLVDGRTAGFSGNLPPAWNAADRTIAFSGGPSLNSYLDAGADLIFDRLPVSQMTVVAKVFVNVVAPAGVAEKDDGNHNSGFLFGWDSTGALRLTVEKTKTNMRVASAAGVIGPGKWMQVAFTWDGTTGSAAAAHLFVNGVEQGKKSSSDGNGKIGYLNATSQPFRIGNAGFDPMAGSLNGRIAYLAVYKGRILTAAELNQLDLQLPIKMPSTDIFGTVTPNGPPTTVTTTFAGQNAQLTFSGTAGQDAGVQLTGNTLGAVTVSLLAPDGTTLSSASSSASSFSLAGHMLPTSGTYTVYVHPAGTTAGSISVAVTLAELPPRPAASVLDTSNPLSTSLAGLFLMNEGSGTSDRNLVDAGLAAFSGASAPSWNTADPSVILNGGPSLNSYLNAGTDLIFDQLPVSRMTVVARVYVATVAAAGVCEKTDNNVNSGFLFGWDSTGALKLTVVRSTANMRVASAAGAVTSGRWMQVAFTWDGTIQTAAAAHVFVNGVELAKASAADGSGTVGYANSTNQPLRIGNASFDFAGALNGRIGYLAVYKGRILTTGEMNQLDSQLPIH